MSDPDAYISLTHIAWDWGVSNQALGKELEAAGYRSCGTPTRKALDEGLAIRCNGRSYRWSRRLVGEFILRQFDVVKPRSPQLYGVVPIIVE